MGLHIEKKAVMKISLVLILPIDPRFKKIQEIPCYFPNLDNSKVL